METLKNTENANKGDIRNLAEANCNRGIMKVILGSIMTVSQSRRVHLTPVARMKIGHT